MKQIIKITDVEYVPSESVTKFGLQTVFVTENGTEVVESTETVSVPGEANKETVISEAKSLAIKSIEIDVEYSEKVPAVVTQELLDENPELAAAGVEVGTPIEDATDEEAAAAEAQAAADAEAAAAAEAQAKADAEAAADAEARAAAEAEAAAQAAAEANQAQG